MIYVDACQWPYRVKHLRGGKSWIHAEGTDRAAIYEAFEILREQLFGNGNPYHYDAIVFERVDVVEEERAEPSRQPTESRHTEPKQ